MSKNYPGASRIGKQFSTGKMESVDFNQFDAPAATVKINLAELSQRLQSQFREDLIETLEHKAGKGYAEERRQAAVEYECCQRIESGEFDKHFIEQHGVLFFDSDGEAYSSVEGRRGEYLDQVEPSKVVGTPAFDDTEEKNQAEQARLDRDADWERKCATENARADAEKLLSGE